MRNLYIEHVNGKILSPKEQESVVIHSDLRQATEKEIEEAEKYYQKYGKCKCHLIYDEVDFMYYSRFCGICGKFISYI